MDIGADKQAGRFHLNREENPALGLRAIRICLNHPEVFRTQLRALYRASACGKIAIMFPMIASVWEVKECRRACQRVMDELTAEEIPFNPDTEIGIMIETPAAVFMAPELARLVDFFSVGTNDLTQMTFGFSRDDAGKFLGAYYDKKIYENDPFAKLDQVGVGKLVEMAAKLGRATRPDLHLGICGEHGGDPSSVEFCHRVGLDYVSCSPFRVPIARLAAAQAAIKEQRQ